MKRRDFLKTAAALGGTLGAIPSLSGCNKQQGKICYYQAGEMPVSKLKHLENEFLSVQIFSDASAKITDKANNVNWDIGPVAVQEEGPIDIGHIWVRTKRSFCEQYPGRFIGKPAGNYIDFMLLGRQNQVMGHLVCNPILENDWLIYKIIKIDESLPCLVFPPPVICESLVIPSNIGKWLRKPPAESRFERYFHPFWTDLNMRWFGGIKGSGAWLAILDGGMPDAGAVTVNRSISPAWLKSLGQWSPPFSVRYKFTKGDYVTLAKTYRKWAIENGIFKSLEEKISENSLLKNYIGGRLLSFHQAGPPLKHRDAEDLWLTKEQTQKRATDKMRIDFTYSQVLQAIERAKTLGFKNGPVIIRGWINGGYDASHPDIWPPEPSLGTIEELKQILSLSAPVVAGLHDNYQDMYDTTASFPKGVNRTADGRLMPAGFWAGGQAYAINSRNGLEYAGRNYRQIKSLSPAAIFIDTTTATQMLQSYEKGNELTRAGDLKYKSELLKFFRQQNLLVGSEETADFGIPYVDWFENRHTRTQGESVPLWPLVFHDAAFCGRYISPIMGESRGDFTANYPVWLEDMLWGYFLLFSINPQWKNEQQFKETFHVDDWHRKIATAEMLSHRFLTEDFKVEETVFSSGQAVICNFSDEPRQVEGTTVPAKNYAIKD